MIFSLESFCDNTQARFATEEEINKLPKADHKKGICERGGIIAKSDGVISSVEGSDNNDLVIGATGRKKTRNIILPSIISSILAGESMVINAMKSDVIDYTIDLFKANGYKVIFLNYTNPRKGHCANPLEIIDRMYRINKTKALEMLRSFFITFFSIVKDEKDRLWDMGAASYAIGLAIIILEEYPYGYLSLYNIYRLHVQSDKPFITLNNSSPKRGGTSVMDKYWELRGENSNAYMQIHPVYIAAEQTKNSYYSVFGTAMTPYLLNDDIIEMTSSTSFSINDIGKEKTVVFIMSNEFNTAYDALISATIDVIYTALGLYSEEHRGLDRRVRFILDEAGNMSPINDFARKISLSRGRDMNWTLAVQSLEQLEIQYGKEVAGVILKNCNNICYLYTPDGDLIKYISEKCGEIYDEERERYVPLCSPNFLRHLSKEKGECLMLLGDDYPFLSHLKDISEYFGVKESRADHAKIREKKELLLVDFRKCVIQIDEDIKKKVSEEAAKANSSMRKFEAEVHRKNTAEKNSLDPYGVDNQVKVMKDRIFNSDKKDMDAGNKSDDEG